MKTATVDLYITSGAGKEKITQKTKARMTESENKRTFRYWEEDLGEETFLTFDQKEQHLTLRRKETLLRFVPGRELSGCYPVGDYVKTKTEKLQAREKSLELCYFLNLSGELRKMELKLSWELPKGEEGTKKQ